MKKALFVLCCLAMAAMVWAGGTQPSGGPVTSGVSRLSITVVESLRIEDYKTNVQTKLIEQQANVDFTFTILPSTDYTNRINLMVMAGGQELTDIICSNPGDAMIYQWAREGAIVPLTKYYNDPAKSPNLRESFNRIGRNYLPDITSPDGEIYGFPSLNQSYYVEMNFKHMYYKPWSDKLGLKFPTTTAEYPAFLRAIVNGDPNGNGRRDEIGLTGQFNTTGAEYGRWFQWLMNSFVYSGDSRNLTVTNGRVGAAYNTNEWREGLRFIRGLVAEDLIPTEALTQNLNQMLTLLNQDGPVVFSFVWDNVDGINASNPAGDLYDIALPLRGPQGLQYATYRPSVANVAMVVSKNCRDVDAAFRVGDLMANEFYGISQRFGAEGKDWDYARNVPNASTRFNPTVPGWPLSIVVYDDALFWGGSAVSNGSWRQIGSMVRAYGIVNGWGLPSDRDTGRAGLNARFSVVYQEEAIKPSEVIPKLIFNDREVTEVTDLLANLQTYVTSSTAAFLAGNMNIDTQWNAYITELNNIGVQRMLTIVQGVYDRMFK